MSCLDVQSFLFELKNDDEMARRFRADPTSVLTDWKDRLSKQEQEMLLARDTPGLYRHGVPAVLLAGAVSALGLHPSESRKALKASFGLDGAGQPLKEQR